MKGLGRFKLSDALPEQPATGDTLPVEHSSPGSTSGRRKGKTPFGRRQGQRLARVRGGG